MGSHRRQASGTCGRLRAAQMEVTSVAAHTLGDRCDHDGVAGVLLAAGEGSRFGQPKALVELDGQTLAERGVKTLVAGGADPVFIVTGAAPSAAGRNTYSIQSTMAYRHGVLAPCRPASPSRGRGRRGGRPGGPAARGRGGGRAPDRRVPGRRRRGGSRLRRQAAQPGPAGPRALARGHRDGHRRPGRPGIPARPPGPGHAHRMRRYRPPRRHRHHRRPRPHRWPPRTAYVRRPGCPRCG